MLLQIISSVLQRSLFGLLMAALGAGIGVGLTTFVSAHGGDTTLIHGCAQNGTGSLRLVDAGEGCRGNETPIDWNQQGIQGHQGIQGPQGLKGDKGDKGDPGAPLASLGALNGIACTVDAANGTVQVSVASSGAISFACVAGSSTPPCTQDCINFYTDPLNCGSLGNDVTDDFPHATGVCVNGQSQMGDCDSGWADLNGYTTDGCELPTDTDADGDGYAIDLGVTGSGLDCDDNDANINPGVAEILGNGIDDNCDGSVS